MMGKTREKTKPFLFSLKMYFNLLVSGSYTFYREMRKIQLISFVSKHTGTVSTQQPAKDGEGQVSAEVQMLADSHSVNEAAGGVTESPVHH